MALLTKEEFAEKCGIKKTEITIYVKRHKIIFNGDGYIDDNMQVNREFYNRRLNKGLLNKAKEIKVELKTEIRNEIPRAIKPMVDQVHELFDEENDESNSSGYFSLDKEKKKLDIKKITEEIEILRVKKDKMHGVVVPSEQVSVMIAQYAKSIHEEFRNSIDKIIVRISKRKTLTNNEVSEIRKEVNEDLNVAINNSVDIAKLELKKIISEFSEKKGKGEKT